MKTLEEVEKLKQNWMRDPIWDIEDTEGFEEHREELLKFSNEQKERWDLQGQREHDRLAAKLCPMKYMHEANCDCHCEVEKCAWWNDHLGVCGMVVDGFLKGISTARSETGK